jgi:hypothetical protein
VFRSPPVSSHVVLSARVHQRRGLALLALGLFQLWLWGTRIVNLLQEVGSFSAAFVAVHLVLYVAAIGAGVILLWFGGRMLREAAARDRSAVPGRGSASTGSGSAPSMRGSAPAQGRSAPAGERPRRSVRS